MPLSRAKFGIRVLLVVISLAAVGSELWAEHPDRTPHLLILAAVSDNPGKLQGDMQPMAEYMAGKLAPLGVEGIEVLVVDSRDQMIKLFRDGRVDWVSETAYSAVLLEEQAGAEILLRKWKQGVPEYRSLIFTRRDSQLHGLPDLVDCKIAFQHPGSTSGYFQPASELRAAGLRLRQLRTIQDRPEPGSLGFLFSGAEYNTSLWVHKRLVDAGVLSSLDWQNEAFLPAGIRDDLQVIFTSDAIPRALELVRGDLHPKIKQAMKQVLLTAHLDPEASTALRAYQDTKKFDDLDEVTRSGLQKIRDMLMTESIPSEVAP